MGKISKGFGSAIATLAILCLIFGICISVISWVLAGKTPTSVSYYEDGKWETSYSIYSYWWGGLGFIVPGILGIAAGYTRNVVAMVFFLIFDILCLLASLGMSVMVALVITFWGTVNDRLGGCVTSKTYILYGEDRCTCTRLKYDFSTTYEKWEMDGVTCEELVSIHGMLVALVALGALAGLMSSIASYVSCCSLCHQEQDSPGAVIVQQPGFVAPANVVVTSTNNYYQPGPQQYPPQQHQPQQYPLQQNPSSHQIPPPYSAMPQQQYPVSHDKAKLVTNEVA